MKHMIHELNKLHSLCHVCFNAPVITSESDNSACTCDSHLMQSHHLPDINHTSIACTCRIASSSNAMLSATHVYSMRTQGWLPFSHAPPPDHPTHGLVLYLNRLILQLGLPDVLFSSNFQTVYVLNEYPTRSSHLHRLHQSLALTKSVPYLFFSSFRFFSPVTHFLRYTPKMFYEYS